MARAWHATLAAVPAGSGPIVARDVSARGAKQYLRLEDARAVLELVASTGAPSFYEHAADAPRTVYFDIDRKSDDDPSEVLREGVEWIRRFLLSLGHDVGASEMLVLDGSRRGKASFHVLVPSLTFPGDAARKKFKSALRERLRADESDVDPAPYDKNALLRTIFSSKFGMSAPLLPVRRGGYMSGADEEYLITHVRDDAVPVFEHIDVPREPERRAHGGDEHESAVCAAVRAAGDETSTFDKAANGRYYFRTCGSRRCLHDARVAHTRNNFVVVVDAHGAMRYRCLSVRCKGELRLGSVAMPTDERGWEALVSREGGTVERYVERYTRPFEVCGVTMLRAPMGSGKTHMLREYLHGLGADARVVIVSFRVSLCRYMHAFLAERTVDAANEPRAGLPFALYKNEPRGAIKQARLIVTVNSLGRLVGSEYDVLVLDESESVLEQFEGVHQAQLRMAWLAFEKLVRDTRRVLCMDAGLGERTYRVVRALRRDIELVANDAPCAVARAVQVQRRDRFWTSLLESLSAHSRVAFASTSAAQLVAAHACVSRMFAAKRYYLIYAGTPEAEKERFSQECNKFLGEYDGLFYSPSIQAGNSIDVPFDEVFVFATPSGPTPEAVHQMVGRVREVRTGRVTVTFDGNPAAEQSEYSASDVAEFLANPLEHHEGTAGMIGAHFTADWKLRLERTALFQLSVWNTFYRVNGFQNFAARFLRLCDRKGYAVTTLAASEEGDTSAGERLRVAMRATAAETRERRLEAVVAAEVLDDEAYARMRKSLAIPTTDEATALAVERYEFCAWYGVEPAALSVDQLRRYARPEQRGAYHRLCLMLPETGRDGASVVRRINDVLRAEGTVLELSSSDHIFAVMTLPRTNGVRLKYAHQLVTDLGFESVFDAAPRAEADVVHSAERLRAVLETHRRNVDAVFLTAGPRRAASEWDTADTVRYVNACLRRFLGVFVRRSRGAYRLVGTGAWDAGRGAPRASRASRMPLRSANLRSVDILG
jgi:hypothetical protein